MKRTCATHGAIAGLLLAISSSGQGTFQNLNFEFPIGPLVGDTAPFASAFPSWVGYVGTNQATTVRIYGINLDNATLALISSNIVSPRIVPLIEGQYTAVLEVGRDPAESPHPVTPVSVSLGQSGFIPVDSLSVRFLAYTVGTPFSVTCGDVNIPVVELQTFPGYKLYGGDISAFAGSTTELKFTAYPDNYPASAVLALDSIQFSDKPIPEPSVISLFSFATLIIGCGCLRNRP
jgi:hypothetical protein